MDALRQVEDWPVENAAVAAVDASGRLATHGDTERVYRWASVTKLLTAYAALVAAEEGTIDLDEPAGPPGSTVRHLLSHASGLPFAAGSPPARRRRGASTRIPASSSSRRSSRPAHEMPFERYLAEAVLEPLGDGR